MTTANSPVKTLRYQATHLAKSLKDISKGNIPADDPGGRLARSLEDGMLKCGIAMDDKVIFIDLEWDMIRQVAEDSLIDFIVSQMQRTLDHAQAG